MLRVDFRPHLSSNPPVHYPCTFANIPFSTLGLHVEFGHDPRFVRYGLNMLLKVENLHVHYGEVKAVNGVSLEIAPGEVLGLVGESGCGKSSAGRAILRLEPIAQGSVVFKGQDIKGFRGTQLKEFRRQAQLVFQDPFGSLNPRITIGGAIEEVLFVHGIGGHKTERTQRVGELLESVGLDARMARRYPHEFSGGQRQRVVIARALALGPELLIADEAVSALDVSVQAEILKLMKEIQKNHNMAYLFISHDLAVVRHMSDRIAVMFKGEIVESGTADDICDRPQHEYTKKLLGAVPDIGSFIKGNSKGESCRT